MTKGGAVTSVVASWPRLAFWGRYVLPVPPWVSAGTTCYWSDKPKLATVRVSQRLRFAVVLAMVTFSCQLSQGPFMLALLVIIILLSCQSPRSARCSSTCRPWRPCRPLFPPVTTGECGSMAQCRTSFARCKSAQMWAGVISASAHRVCWVSAGAGTAESGSPPGLIAPCFGTQSTTLSCVKCPSEMCNTLCCFARDGQIKSGRS